MKADGSPKGRAAERLAAEMLIDRGYRILETNYKSRVGEIDIVATVDNLLILVEVKQRTGERFGSAEEAVDGRKIRKILDTAEYFIVDHPEFAGHIWRLDLIAITLRRNGSILRKRHIENLVVD
jgi:putative endonuclease